MNSRLLGTVITFTALTILLSQIRIPLPFPPPGFTYQIYQIPIIVSLLLIGQKYAITIAFLNMLVQMIFPVSPMGILGPPYAFLITLSLILGVYLSSKFFPRLTYFKELKVKRIGIMTAIATIIRTLLILPLDFILFGALLSIALGISTSEAYAFAFGIMPGIILFNIIVPIYVIPTSYIITYNISKRFKQTFWK